MMAFGWSASLTAAYNRYGCGRGGTLQSRVMVGREGAMAKNNAGGFSFKVSDRTLVRRFIFLGSLRPQFSSSEGGSEGTGSMGGNGIGGTGGNGIGGMGGMSGMDGVEGGVGAMFKDAAALVAAVDRVIASGAGVELVAEVKAISLEGRAAKQDYLLQVLALLARRGDKNPQYAAYASVRDICRIPTFLFTFLEACHQAGNLATGNADREKEQEQEGQEEQREQREQRESGLGGLWAPKKKREDLGKITKAKKGWGRAQRKVVADWYLGQNPTSLAFAITKYRRRGGWSHRDVLRLCHAKPTNQAQQAVFEHAVNMDVKQKSKGDGKDRKRKLGKNKHQKEQHQPQRVAMADLPEHAKTEQVKGFFKDLAKINSGISAQEAIELIQRHRLAREHIPQSFLADGDVWRAMLPSMPLNALMRCLNRLTALGLFEDEAIVSDVVQRLTDVNAIKAARLHPFNILNAMRTYDSGMGLRGRMSWRAEREVVNALDRAFNLAFAAVEPTNKRYLLGLDVSGSMSSSILNSSVSCRDGCTAMAMVTLATEPFCKAVAFCDSLIDVTDRLDVSKSLNDNVEAISRLPFGGTDCALPMTHAIKTGMLVDCFIVYTDSETWFGSVHPMEALRNYRTSTGIDAKLIVVGMASSGFSIADPDDHGALDMVGFDTSAPEIIAQFAGGKL